jgi:radical SAM superfamily enzyme YgiQ (UPF0313 family)
MKISISYPPLPSSKGTPLLTQNRQFQWFSKPTYIYPMVPSMAATLLQHHGHEVFWDDAIAEELTPEQWQERIANRRPELVVLESKTPVIQAHWEICRWLKGETRQRAAQWRPLVALVGDHVTALPEETMEQSPADFVLTGGDYDFLLVNLAQCLRRVEGGSLALDPGGLEPGIYFRQEGGVRHSGAYRLDHDLDSLPFIDRELTCWRNYAYKNGNFKYRPGTYTMAARDCWWGKCSFCSWTTLYPGEHYRARQPGKVLEEMEMLAADLGVKEVFDDSGCFPRGKWLNEFCQEAIAKGLHRRVRLGCNMRVGGLTREQYQLMCKAGFRFVLIGLESVNQQTLDRLNKGIRVEQIRQTLQWAKQAGLEPHLTIMMGYPWEDAGDARETLSFAQDMFNRGLLDSLQATIVVPYPGTPLYEEARRQGWLLTNEWDRYDMKESVWQSPLNSQQAQDMTRQLYRAAFSPRFLIRKLLAVRRPTDLAFLLKSGVKLAGHLADFKHKKGKEPDCGSCP